MPRRIVLASLLLAPLLLTTVTGCAVASGTPDETPTSVPSQPTIESTGSYRVVGGGAFASGETLLCTINDPILIEDLAAITSDELVPTTTMSFRDGRVAYATIWPDEVVGVGVTSGEGTYTIEVDGDGVPLELHAEATVTYSEADGTFSDRDDTVDLIFTQVETPDYCTG